MHKLVKRVTIVHGSGEDRRAEMVYRHEDENESDKPDLSSQMSDTPRSGIKVGQQAAKAGLEAAEGASQFGIPKLGAFGIPKLGPFGIPKFGDDKD